MDEADKGLQPMNGPRPLEEKRELPVVTRLVIEIRSDGMRTQAHGALEDAMSGERVEIKAQGATPLLLIASLLRSLVDVPLLARKAATLFLNAKKKDH
jgi:hypothetical protein